MKYCNNSYFILTVFFLIQITLVSYSFPIQELFSNTPLFYIDNGYHWYTLKMHSHLLADASKTIYDPFFNAGYPFGFFNDPSAHPAKIINYLFSDFLSEKQVWKIYVFIVALIGPVLPGLGLFVLKFKPAQIAIGTLLSCLMWWTGWFHWFHTAGMASYVFGCFFAFFVGCYVLRVKDNITVFNTLMAGILGAIMVLIHPLSIIPIFFMLCSFFLFNPKQLFIFRKFLFFSAFSLLSVTLNYWWLLDAFSPLSKTGFNIVSYQANIQPSVIVFEMMGVWQGSFHGSKVYPLLLILSSISFFVTSKTERQEWVYPFFITWFSLQLFASLAGFIPELARLTEPNRHAPVGYLFLIIPSVFCLFKLPKISGIRLLNKKIFVKYFFILVVGLLTVLCMREVTREVSRGDHGRYGAKPPLVHPLGGYTDFVLKTLAEHTDNTARVLFETSLGRIHDQGHLAGYYAYTSDREFIGGPYTYRYFAGFWDGFVFGKPINEHAESEFIKYLSLYNIGWVVAHSEESKEYFNKIAILSSEYSYKELKFYKVDIAHSFFYKGSGTLDKSSPNMLKLKDIIGDDVILKYHYIEGLVADSNIKIEPVLLAEDPLPFIRVVNPPKEITLSIK